MVYNVSKIPESVINYYMGQLAQSLAGQRVVDSSGFIRVSRGGTIESGEAEFSEGARQLILEMVENVMRNGYEFVKPPECETEKLSGGARAEFVSVVWTTLPPFVAKVDQRDEIIGEAKVIKSLSEDSELPEDVRKIFPKIFDYRSNPNLRLHGYLMEYFDKRDNYFSLTEWLCHKLAKPDRQDFEILQSRRLSEAVFYALKRFFLATKSTQMLPNIYKYYIGIRIAERLTMAANRCELFEPKAWNCNGKEYKPWDEYLKILEDSKSSIAKLAPPFVCKIHGDPNPGNILVRDSVAGEPEIHMIDLKNMTYGDYIFDITKLTHYLEVTACLKDLEEGYTRSYDDTVSPVSINYSLDIPQRILESVKSIKLLTENFAHDNDDHHWEMRYDLGMAAHLLGIVDAWLDVDRDHATIIFAEGLRRLDGFCEKLKGFPSLGD